jgi:hypothetical protein
MTKLTLALLGLTLVTTQAFAECTQPEAPAMPDGATGSMEDMLAGQKSVKSFQEANVDYMKCLEVAFTAAEAAAQEGTDEEKAAATEAYTSGMDAYNDAVSQEEAVAGQFNVEIRDYKAANPPS